MPRKILLDCDPGHDDAIALLLAHGSPEIELLAVTTVAGNQTLEKVTRNALAVAPRRRHHRRAVRRRLRPPAAAAARVAGDIHGESGLDGPVLPEPDDRARPAARRRPDHRHGHGAPARHRHARADRSADQRRARRPQGAADRRAGRRGRAHGRRPTRAATGRRQRVQHRLRPGGGADRVPRAVAGDDGRAGPHPPGAGHAGGRRPDRGSSTPAPARFVADLLEFFGGTYRTCRVSPRRRCTTRARSRSSSTPTVLTTRRGAAGRRAAPAA